MLSIFWWRNYCGEVISSVLTYLLICSLFWTLHLFTQLFFLFRLFTYLLHCHVLDSYLCWISHRTHVLGSYLCWTSHSYNGQLFVLNIASHSCTGRYLCWISHSLLDIYLCWISHSRLLNILNFLSCISQLIVWRIIANQLRCYLLFWTGYKTCGPKSLNTNSVPSSSTYHDKSVHINRVTNLWAGLVIRMVDG
jgi:hypothetical protein